MKSASITIGFCLTLSPNSPFPLAAPISEWTTQNGDWSNSTNWNSGVPGAGDIARIGNLPAAFNGVVELNANTFAAGLDGSTGMECVC